MARIARERYAYRPPVYKSSSVFRNVLVVLEGYEYGGSLALFSKLPCADIDLVDLFATPQVAVV